MTLLPAMLMATAVAVRPRFGAAALINAAMASVGTRLALACAARGQRWVLVAGQPRFRQHAPHPQWAGEEPKQWTVRYHTSSVPDYVGLRVDPYSAHQIVLAHCSTARAVLDVGCSAGALGRPLASRGVIVDGIEFDDAAAAEARAWYRRVIVGDVEHTSLDLEPGSYDAIICADILEHLRHPEELLMRLRPLLAAGGVLLVSIPNISNWSMRLLHLMGRWEYTDRGILDRTHVRFYYRRSFERLIHQSGYPIRALDVTVPLPLLRREPFNRLAHWFGLRCKNLLAYQFVAVAEPLE